MVVKSVEHSKTEDRVINAIAWELNVPSTILNPYTDLVEDLYLDPLDKELLIAKLERDFKVVFSIEDVACIETIRDASHFIQLRAAS